MMGLGAEEGLTRSLAEKSPISNIMDPPRRRRIHEVSLVGRQKLVDGPPSRTMTRIWVYALLQARQTFSEVTGMSIEVTPRGSSACKTALTKAAGPAIAPASPQPLTPSGLFLQGVVSDSMRISGRSSARGRA